MQTTTIEPSSLQCSRSNFFLVKADLPVSAGKLRAGGICLDESMVARACTEALGEPIDGVEPLPPGTIHRLWRIHRSAGDSLIFRANAWGEWFCDESLLLDTRIGAALQHEGLPSLRVHACDLTRTICPTEFAILEEARGVSLRSFDANDQILLPLLQELGRFVAKVHRISIDAGYGLLDAKGSGEIIGSQPTWWDYVLLNLDSHVNSCLTLGSITEEEADRILELFEKRCNQWDHAPAVLLHGDLGNHNVFVEKSNIHALIDWEDALAGDPVYDIAFWATFHPERRHRSFLEGYCEEAELPNDFEERFWLYFLRVSLAKTVIRHRFGIPDAPGREPAARRIQRALGKLTLEAY